MRPIKSLPPPFQAGALSLAAALLLAACKPTKVDQLVQPSQALASVVAEETVRLAGANKQVAIITHDSSWGDPSAAETALRVGLKKRGVTVVTAKAARLGNPMTSGQVGLTADDFFEGLAKAAGSGAVISLVGPPLLNPSDAARLKADHPPVVVIATASLGDKMGVHGDPVQLAGLLDAKVIRLAVIDGAGPATAPGAKADPARELFDQNYRILRAPE